MCLSFFLSLSLSLYLSLSFSLSLPDAVRADAHALLLVRRAAEARAGETSEAAKLLESAVVRRERERRR